MVRIICGLIISTILFWAVVGKPFFERYGFYFNVTDSLPGYAFITVKGDVQDLKQGELVSFYPRKNRFYPSDEKFLKMVLGVGGDRVTYTGRDAYINGKYHARAKTVSKSGLPLVRGKEGVIPNGFIYVGSEMVDGFDSRYEDIGWIDSSTVIGRSFRIF